MVHNNDISHLRRLATNFYDDDKALINRVIKGIADLANDNARLKSELQKLRDNK